MLTVHRIAKTYGKWPHEVLNLEPFELAIAEACIQQADATTALNIMSGAVPVASVVV